MKKQIDINDCGLVVIQAIHKHFHDEWININELKTRAYMTDKGINISNLISLGGKYGIKFEALEGDIKSLLNSNEKNHLVTLIKTDETYHYVIIKIFKKYISVLDPVKGKYKLSYEKFSSIYQNVIITFSEIPFTKKKLDKISGLVFKDPVIIFILITSVIISIIITFSSSIYMKVIIDKIIPQELHEQLLVISLIFIWLAFIKSFNTFIKKYFSRKLMLNINYNFSMIYINKISNASLNSLNKISNSDHLRRLGLIESASNFITTIMFVIFGDVIMLFTSVGILFWISTKLFVVVIITATLSISIISAFNFLIKEEYSNTINYQHKFLSTSIELVSTYEKLKEIDYRNYAQEKFRKDYVKYKFSESKIFWLKTASIVWETIIDMVAPIIITFIATKSVFNHEISIGSMIMFVSLFRTFLNPLDSIATTILNIPLGLKNLNLIKYILLLDNEKLNRKGYISKKIKTISLNDIDFGLDRSIFKIKNFKISNNIRISGKNGIGKTSFMKLLSCRYGIKGKHFINNIELPFINKEEIRNRIYFSNNEFIPDVTIFEYITLLDPKKAKTFSENIHKFELQKLFEIVQLDLSKNLYHNGSNISGGQLQIIKLLRLLTKQYDLILLDEATDNITLDVIKLISKAINKYQKGIFIEVSHNNKYISKGKEVNIEKIIKC